MFGAALRQVAAKGAELASNLVREVESVASTAAATVGPYGTAKFQSQFRLGAPTGSVGGLWRVYAGTARAASAVVKEVSIWVLDKKELQSRGDGGSLPSPGSSGLLPSSSTGPGLGASGTGAAGVAPGQRWEAVFEQQRHGCALMMRLKHPGVVRVVLPLEETSSYMILVTEAVRGCLRDVMSAPHHPQNQQPHTAGHAGPGQGGHGHGHGHGEQGGEAGGPGGGGGGALSSLEVKLGLLAVAESLTFLHSAAKLAHCGLSPQTVVVAADGAWKLAGFGFAVSEAAPAGQGGQGGAGPPPYAYNDPFPPLWEEMAKPQLPYTAPELVVPPGGSVGPWAHTNPFGPTGAPGACSWAPADAFSLGALVYELVTWAAAVEAAAGPGGVGVAGMVVATTQLLPVRCSLQQYGARVGALAAAAAGGAGAMGLGSAAPVASELARLPPELRGMLLSLVSPVAASRPAPAALARCSWFEDDGLLRALRFLEGIMQSEPRHKLAFLSDLAAPAPGPAGPGPGPGPLWQRMSDRLLASRVLPPLLQEVRNGGTVGVAALPVVLAVCQRLGRGVFAGVALPVLAPAMDAAGGSGGGGAAGGGGGGAGGGGAVAAEAAMLLPAFVSQSEALAALMDGPTLDKVLLPLLVRALAGPSAADGGPATGQADPRLAQAALSRLQALVAAGLVDPKSAQARTRLLPALHTAVGRTTSAAVRVSCLSLMAALAAKVDRSEAEGMLATCAQLLSVDTSGNTLVAVAGLAEALAEAPGWGPPATAARLLPLLMPHIVAPTLTPAQLATFAAAVQTMLRRVVRHAEEAAALRASGGDPAALQGATGLRAPGVSVPESSTSSGSSSRGSGAGAPGGVVAFTTWTHSRPTGAATAPTTTATGSSAAAAAGPAPAAPSGSAPAAPAAAAAAPTWPTKPATAGTSYSHAGANSSTAASGSWGSSATDSSSSAATGASPGMYGGAQKPMATSSSGRGGYGGGGGLGAGAANPFGPTSASTSVTTAAAVAAPTAASSSTLYAPTMGASRDPFAASAAAPPAAAPVATTSSTTPMASSYSSTPAPMAYASRPAPTASTSTAAPPDLNDPFAASMAPFRSSAAPTTAQPQHMHGSSSAPSLPYGATAQLGNGGGAGGVGPGPGSAAAGAGPAGPALSAAQIANLAAAGLIVGGGAGGGGGAAKPSGGLSSGAAPALGGWGTSAPAPVAPAVAAPTLTLAPPPAAAPRKAGGPVNLMDL
ncbi:hypothetical protein HXX76_006466 [Chlamydomonas incerta]|uniref:Protein kinase domain-containing protein n=1 Tax=Chlamydomonas incerta TaxID=51695 RepID=A0A835TDS1_CHLIN|nr:hypothetical protein HXX76_006466 [Chlamydomonas incerta]|eukprot:KAG2436950.1 hypothetical protein HXX76_006466 [Chlamydomonas incerta]